MLHSYVCEDKGSLPDCDVVSNRLTNCWEVDPENQENGKCLFTPKIQVKDNWEMCNGGIVGEVCPSDVNKWAAFGSQTPTATAKGGKIIVEP